MKWVAVLLLVLACCLPAQAQSATLMLDWQTKGQLTVTWNATQPVCVYLDRTPLDIPCAASGQHVLTQAGDEFYAPRRGRVVSLVLNDGTARRMTWATIGPGWFQALPIVVH